MSLKIMESPVIWITDDDDAVRDSVQILMEADGYRIRGFALGSEVIHAAHTSLPHCLILDLNLPDMDGFEVMAALGAMKVDRPTILITGHGTPRHDRKAEQAGAFCLLHKPVDAGTLFDAVREAVAAS